MRLVTKGGPYWIERGDGTKELAFPCDVEMTEEEAEEFARAAKESFEKTLAELKARSGK